MPAEMPNKCLPQSQMLASIPQKMTAVMPVTFKMTPNTLPKCLRNNYKNAYETITKML